MEFNSLQQYIQQVYGARVTDKFLQANAPALTFLKLVRALRGTEITTQGKSAEDLFIEADGALNVELAAHLFALADLHEIIEGLLRLEGQQTERVLRYPDDRGWADAVNS